MSLSNNFPDIQPSLNLSFALTKKLDPRITFVRTTTARYYDGKTTAKAEENLLLQSQTFETSWTATNVTVAANTGDTTAPDGTSTAEKLTITGGSAAHGVAQSLSMVVATYTVSVFAKKGTQFYLRFGRNTGAAIPAPGTWWWDVDAGTFNGTLGAGWANQSITSVGNDWYRCAVSVTTTAAGTDGFTVALTDNAGNNIFSQDNNTFYIWGAQLEQRSAVTAYTPTTTQPITNYVPVLLTAASGVARFDHNPTTGESLGLLVEEQRTNLLTYSAEFDNAAWTKSRVSIESNTIVAPDGTLTGDKIVENTDNNTHAVISANIAKAASAITYTLSCYAKRSGRSLSLIVNNASFADRVYAGFNLSNGTVSGTGEAYAGGFVSASITSVGNGWFRCVLVAVSNTDATISGRVFTWDESSNTSFPSYTGDGYSGIYIWGAQLEAGAFPTSYIATTSASVTRNADAASMTGTNFSSWYNLGEGGFLAAYSRSSDKAAGNQIPMMVSDGTGANIIAITDGANGSADRVLISANNVSQMNTGSINYTANQLIIRSVGYKVDDCATSANGAAVVTDTSALIPVVNQLTIGFAPYFSTSRINGHIRKLAYYPKRIANAELQALTTV